MITYKSIGQRTNYIATDSNLVKYIEINTNTLTNPEVKDLIKLGLTITSRKLNFTTGKNEIDPNKLISTRTAHCVGYASFFATTCNYLFKKYHLDNSWAAKPQIGQLYFLGANIHKYLHNPFFKDHDFVIVENSNTGEAFAVDPTINDYLFIEFVSYGKPIR